MKFLLCLITLSISLNLFAWNDEYKFSHFKRVDDFDFREVVLDYKDWSIVVINNGRCSLGSTMNRCFPFEMKLNTLAPKIFARNNNIQIINMDTESTYTHQQYDLKVIPAVIFFYKGQMMEKLEAYKCYPYSNPSCDYNRMNWANDLLQRTLDVIYKIPASI